jgi:proteasome assembly chaperone (PAC2) family protein
MAEKLRLNHPWMVAVWPGMGNVALNAGIYLLAKLGMTLVAELEANELFDVDQVEVKDGIIQRGGRPRNRFFVWTDPHHKHDLVVFIGEAQPPIGKFVFCKQLIGYCRELGIEHVFTFAAMATQMLPDHESRVFGAATDEESLDEIKDLDLEILEDGHIGGLNGVLLGAAAEAKIPGTCLLGEMPHIFNQLPFPKASLAILRLFTSITEIDIDFAELEEQSQVMEERLGELLSDVEKKFGQQFSLQDDEPSLEPPAEDKVDPAKLKRIEELFSKAQKDRSKSFELKQELDRQGVFKEYEDRFLDLFKKSG